MIRMAGVVVFVAFVAAVFVLGSISWVKSRNRVSKDDSGGESVAPNERGDWGGSSGSDGGDWGGSSGSDGF